MITQLLTLTLTLFCPIEDTTCEDITIIEDLDLLEDIISSRDEEIIESFCYKTTNYYGSAKSWCSYECPGLGSCKCGVGVYYCSCMSLTGSQTRVDTPYSIC